MRIDPKYFNRFIAGTALLTAVIIIYSTVRYNQKQTADFEQAISEISFPGVRFVDAAGDSLTISDMAQGRPAVVTFWSTWSDKSHQVNLHLNEYQEMNPDIAIIAASVRDNEALIKNYMDTHPFDFVFVNGTDFYQDNLFPGLPAQLFFTENGELFTTHIGNRTENITSILKSLNRE